MVRPAGPTEVLEILLNSTEVQTQRDVEMKSPPRLLGFRFDDDACNDMFSTTDGECEKGAAYKHRGICTGHQDLASVVQDPLIHCAC